MIARGMQRMSSTAQIHDGSRPLLFNTLVDSWPKTGTSPSPITYSNGYFYIQNPHISDFLITWFISIKTTTMTDSLGDNFSLYMVYGNGMLTEGDSSSTILGTHTVTGFKYLHVVKLATTTTTLKLYIQSCSFISTSYLTSTDSPVGNLLPSQVANASISIISI